MSESPALKMYADDDVARKAIGHPTSRFKPGAVVRCISTDRRCGAEYGAEFKIRTVDQYTQQFGVWGAPRTLWYVFRNFEVLVGKKAPTRLDDYELRAQEMEAQLVTLREQAARAKEEAAAKAALEAEVAEGYADAPPVRGAAPAGRRRNTTPAIEPGTGMGLGSTPVPSPAPTSPGDVEK